MDNNNQNQPFDKADESQFIEDVRQAFASIKEKYFSQPNYRQAIVLMAIDTVEMPDVNGMPCIAIADKISIFGSDDVLVPGIGKQLNNPDGFFAGLISDAWACNVKKAE